VYEHSIMFHKSIIPPKHQHRLLGLILISLHSVLWWDFINVAFSKILLPIILVLHFSLFILWQWDKFSSYSLRNIMLLSIVILIFVVFPNIWLITLWQLILLAVIGGQDVVKPYDRFVNLAAIIFLSLNLFTINLYQLFNINELALIYTLTPNIFLLFQYGLLSIPLIFLFISTDNNHEHRYYIDFFHGLILVMIVTIIALGSVVLMYSSNIILPLAIFQMSLIVTVLFLVISLFWLILVKNQGIDYIWRRHLYNIGSPLEQWLEDIAQPSNYKNITPQEFLHAGFEKILTLSWIKGISWHSLYGEEQLGHQNNLNKVIITVQSIEVTIYSNYRISASHYFQVKILIQLLEHFHQAKRREAAFAQQAHLQAIHETGAKLTHDIKNLLQSLHVITSVIETYPPTQFGNTQRLLQGQMPRLTQRLKRTLDKLQKPAEFSYSHVPVNLWWGNLQARYRKSDIEFINDTAENENILIPEDLFDNVSENLLQNALMKRKREPNLYIKVGLYIEKGHLKFTVCDDGSIIPDEIAKNLLTQPVPSRDGFGIGLYQAVKQLANTGYKLEIMENQEGKVCFELKSCE
jgi:hypothetical protein